MPELQTPPAAASAAGSPATPLPEGNAMSEIMAAMNEANAFKNGVPTQPDKPSEKPPAPALAPKTEPAKPAPSPTSLPDPTAQPTSTETPKSDDDEPANLSPELKPNWKRLREEKKAAQKELETLRAEVAKIKGNGHGSEEWLKEKETLVKEREDLLGRLQASAIERDPRFQAYFNGREKFFVEQAKKLGGEQGPKLSAVLAMPDSDARSRALDEIMVELPISAQSRVGSLVNDIDRLRSEKDTELAKASETFTAMQQKQQNEHREFQARANNLMEETIKSWSDPAKGIPVFQKREGDEEWNKSVDLAIARSKHIYSGQMTIEEKARASLWAAAAPQLLNELRARDKRISELEKSQTELKAAQPGSGSGQGQSDATPSEEKPDDMPLAQWITRQASKVGALTYR